MSLFSRLFGKAPPMVAPPEKPAERSDATPAQSGGPVGQPKAPERAALAVQEEEELKAAIEAHDVRAIARFVTQGSSTKVRQQAAHAVEDPAQLRQLIKEVRGGNDKTVYRILMQKRDAGLAQTRQAEQRRAEIEAAAAAIERHSHRHYDAVFTPTLDQLQVRWHALAADADSELQGKVQAAVDRAREVIAEHLRQIAAEASRELAAANAAAHALAVREQEQKAAAAEAAERARIAEEERKALAEKREAQAQAMRQIGGLIRKAQAALAEGSTGRAAGLRRAIEEKVAGSPALPAHLANQLQQLDVKLAELKDWKNFTVAPKRTELMEEMESLVGATLDPPVLAERIKSLQEDWRTLSKGAGENLEADWQRFQEAAQKAYQPCREYFEAQALQRQENLQHRAALFERLAAFEAGHNWEQPDWRTVVVALRESRQEWRRYAAVERAPGKALQQKFDALSASLQARLDAEYARNIKAKQTLIERAQRLLAGEDIRKAIEDVKALQQQWRAVGLVPRAEDQRLWEQFRRQCDAVFQRRQHESNEYTAALEANKAKAAALCEELEGIARLSGKELLEGAAKAADLRVAFEEIGELPRAEARGLHARFERALQACERAVARQNASDADRSWSDLFDVANRVRAYRLAASRAADAAECDCLRQEVETHIASVAHWPKGGLETLKRELVRGNSGDIAANEKALRLLCVRAEIITDTATPPEDQSLRREYQVQRLIKNMGQGSSADEATLDAMAMEWVSVGPTEEATYLALLERFKRCRERYSAAGGPGRARP
jgi:hypothetical protein